MFARFDEWLEGLPPGRVARLMVGVFAAVHVFYYALGVGFDAAPLSWYWQYLEPDLLKRRLLESVYYLHSQAPLFNLFLGAVLKAYPRGFAFAFHLYYLLMGFGLYAGLYALQRRLGVARGVAFLLSTAFIVGPSFILFEHWLYYTLPLAALLLAAALCFHAALTARGAGAFWAAAGFGFALFMVCGIRHLFNLAYFVAAAAALVAFARGRRRRVGAAVAVPFALLLALYAKNYVLFGELHLSSWGGMYIWQVCGPNLTPEETARLRASGEMTPASLVPPFSDLKDYPPSYRRITRFKNIPALMRVHKAEGPNNYHHYAYAAIGRDYLRDSLYVLRHCPRAFLKGWTIAWVTYVKSNTGDMGGYSVFGEALANPRLAAVAAVFDTAVYEKVPLAPLAAALRLEAPPRLWDTVYPALLVGLPLLLLYGLLLAFGGAGCAAGLTREQRLTVLFLCFNILYLAVVANSCGYSETNRMRFKVDAFYAALLALFLQQYVYGPWRAGRRRRV